MYINLCSNGICPIQQVLLIDIAYTANDILYKLYTKMAVYF